LNHELRYRIYEADAHVTQHLAGLVEEHKRVFDMRAALDFLLAKDPTYEATEIGGLEGKRVYAKATSEGYPDIPRLLLLYVVDDVKMEVVIHSGHLI